MSKKSVQAQQIAGELIAEILVVFVKVFVVNLTAYVFGPLWAALVAGLFIFIASATFGMQLNSITDPLVNLWLLIVNAIDARKTGQEITKATWVVTAIKIIIDVGMPCLAGLALPWITGAQLPAVFAINNMMNNNGWATGIMTAIVLLLAFHVIPFLFLYSADGMAASLAAGAAYSVFSAFLVVVLNGYMDITVDIGIAIALSSNPNPGWFWYLLIIKVAAAALSLGLYYALWNVFFSASVLEAKRNAGTVNDLRGALEEKQPIASVHQSGRRAVQAVSSLNA